MRMISKAVVLLIILALGPAWADEVEVTLFQGGEGLEFYRRVADSFEKKYPETKLLLSGDPAIADKMRMRVLEGNLPEVSNANVDVWGLIKHGQIQPLDPWLDQERVDGQTWRDSFLPGSLDAFTYEGKTYGVPLVYVVWSVYYNKALFEEKGWTPARNWDEFRDLCEQVKKEGHSPIAFQGQYSFYSRPLVEQAYFHLAGRQAYQALLKGEKGAFASEAMEESLAFLDQLSGEFFQSGYQGMSHTAAQLEFFQGRAAMLFCGSWLYSEMKDNIPEDFELGAFPLPYPESPNARPGAQYSTANGYFFVFSKSGNPEGGARFLELMTSADQASRIVSEQGYPVAIKGANSQLHFSMSDVAEQIQNTQETFGTRSGPGLKGLDQVWTDSLALILSHKSSPKQVAESMEEEVAVLRQRAENPNSVTHRHPKKGLTFLLLFIVAGASGLLLFKSPQLSKSGSNQTKLADRMSFLLPSVLIFSVFFVLPSIAALAGSLFRWDGLGQPEFVGLLHFHRLLFESDVFWQALANNLFLMVVPAVFVMPLALFLAELLRREVLGARFFRIAFFFPNLMGVAGVLLWQQLYNPKLGPVNKLLVGSGLESFQDFAWLSVDNLYWALIPMGIWSATGFNMVLFLAAMQSVPDSLYEAAQIHGANPWQQFLYVTLPAIRETVATATILMIIGGMKAFEAIWLLTNQSPTSESHVVGTLMVRSLFVEQRIGQAASLACLLFFLVLVGSVLTQRLSAEEGA